MREIELKFLLDEASSRALLARVKALKLASGAPKTKTLRSIYLDTPEHALKRGIALRLRRDGRRWIQTNRQIHTAACHRSARWRARHLAGGFA